MHKRIFTTKVDTYSKKHKNKKRDAYLGSHCLFQHIQTDRTHELTVKTSRRNCNFRIINDGILGGPMQFVQRKLPGLIQTNLFRTSHNAKTDIQPIDLLFFHTAYAM